MRVFVLVLILTLFVLLTGNVGRVIYRWGRGSHPVRFGVAYGGAVTVVLTLFVLSRVPDIPVARWLLQGSHYLLGIFVYGLLIFNSAALILGLVRLVLRRTVPGTVQMGTLICCIALVAGLSGYGIIHAGALQTVTYSVTVDKQTEPIRIALVSDLHMGYIMEERRLQKIADTINDMEPDVVCIAGDLFDGDMTALSEPEKLQGIFRSIHAPVYACLGNHDAGAGHEQMLTFLEGAGVHVLLDETAVVDDRLLLVGRRDSSPIGAHEGTRTEAVALPEGNALPVVVLDHQPGNIDQYGDEVDLILCGHTHRGQLFPGNLITARIYTVDYGYYRATDTAPQVIVTSGAGTWGPVLRVGSDCEVAQILIRGQ